MIDPKLEETPASSCDHDDRAVRSESVLPSAYDPVRDLLVALQFLTRLPLASRPWQPGDIAASTIMFPVCGVVIGGIAALAYIAATLLGLPPLLAAPITLVVLVLITGALHEDGLADVADGLGGGRTAAAKLEIMRDSRLGSYGGIALVLGLMLRAGALATLAEPVLVAFALVASGTISRALLPLAMSCFSNARKDGLAVLAGRPHLGRSLVALLVGFLIMLICVSPSIALLCLLWAGIAAYALIWFANRVLGGVTGDVIGAGQQMAEIGCLLALVAAL